MTTVHIDMRDPVTGDAVDNIALTFTPTRCLDGVGVVPTKRVTLNAGQADVELLATDDPTYGTEPWAYRVCEYIGNADGVYRYVLVPTSAHLEYDDLEEVAPPGSSAPGSLPGGGGNELPTGGTTGQVLTKASNSDGDVEWANVAVSAGVSSVNGRTGAVTLSKADIGMLTKTDVGLSNVDNTSDDAKPVSAATAAALAGKANISHSHSEADVSGLSTDLSRRPIAYTWSGTAYVPAPGAGVYVGSTDPGSVADGSIWYDTSGA